MNPPLPGTDFSREPRSALQAREAAQWIAFAPFIFQAARCLVDLGVLAALDASREAGCTAAELAAKTGLSPYALRVLLEAGLGLGMVLEQGEGDTAIYRLAKTGWFWLHDAMTRANAGFTQHVNYQGLFHLDDALREGRPAGLDTFGRWPTIYRALAELPERVRKAWLAFDHHYSDVAFAATLPEVFAHRPRQLLDIGGNTGRFEIGRAHV
jgi:hypothetical protein